MLRIQWTNRPYEMTADYKSSIDKVTGSSPRMFMTLASITGPVDHTARFINGHDRNYLNTMWDLFTLRSRAMVLPMPWYQICSRLSVTKTLLYIELGYVIVPIYELGFFLMDSEMYRREMNSLTIRVRHQFRIFTKRFDIRLYTAFKRRYIEVWSTEIYIHILKITLEQLCKRTVVSFGPRESSWEMPQHKTVVTPCLTHRSCWSFAKSSTFSISV